MLSPVGSQPASVYWRRRLFLFASIVIVVLLLVLTVKVVGGGSDDTSAAAGPSTGSSSARATSTGTSAGTTSAPGSSSRPASSADPDAASRSAATAASSAAPSTSVRPQLCALKSLAVQATVGKSAYKTGEQPVVSMQVTNTGSVPCIQDLADKQVVLRVYNGESRVWGSHDCEIQPGTTDRTLPVGQAVKVSITWSGRTSQAGCKGTRQRVGAGTYTLYAQLSGKSGKAAQFTIS